MIKTLLKQVGEYKRVSILTPLFTALEVFMEVLMLILAFFSLYFGIMAGRYGAEASSGFAANLREGMYDNIQTFSFSNIDKYSTAGLVTRMTTDITNMQVAFQMSLRIAVRSPLMLICSLCMCFVINRKLSLIFLAAIFVLTISLILIMSSAVRYYGQVFDKYDELNGSIQENVSAIRVVKAFVREDYEKGKFKRAAENLYQLFVKAESLLALNNPVMMLVVYGCMIGLSWFGAHYIVIGDLTTGELTSMFSYVMGVLMSLMMLSMVFVILTMSAASGRRIEQFPDKYDSWIEQGGTNVSGGQKQRLCIARALLKRPKVLIPDDSTSAVDTATDAKIREAFRERIPGTTKIIIAQRISSVQDADRILVLEDGQVSGFDTHDNLLQSNQIYREIYDTQMKGGGDFDHAPLEREQTKKEV